jgi:iron-sulfur cluster assembly protein
MVSLTELASKKIRLQLSQRRDSQGIRIGVKTTGCSGLAYILEYVDQINPDDQVFICDDVNVYVDPKSLIYIQGLEMDWVKQGLNEGFEFNNPNSKGECGCGESFRV